ncbi:MAG: thioredoxin family protein [Propionibacteriaceae bacterium]|nr:thioredoxin family protein [Propionibacteriaceae bacterium]
MPTTPILITYFTAPWCAPCRQLAPRVRTIAEAVGATVRMVDIDTDPRAAARADVRSVPTVVVTRGDDAMTFTGASATPATIRSYVTGLID